MRIRKGTRKDIRKCIAIDLEAFPDQDYDMVREHLKEEWFFVAEDKGGIIGLVSTEIDEISNDFFIAELAVKKEYRGKGVGTRLVEHVKKLAKKRRMRRVFIDTWSTNRRGIAMFKKLGFRMAGRVNKLYNEHTNSIFLSWKVR